MLPTDSKQRKGIPVYEGFIKYFPDAIAAVAQCSAIANAQHNGEGSPVEWAKHLSCDEKDAMMRHLLDSQFTDRDEEGIMHMVKVGWRAFANLQRMHDAGIDIYALIAEVEEDQYPSDPWGNTYEPSNN
jgi:hypothetical protein